MSQNGKCELDVYFAKSPGTLFFSLVRADKNPLCSVSACRSVFSYKKFSVSAVDESALKLPLCFTEYSGNQGKKLK